MDSFKTAGKGGGGGRAQPPSFAQKMTRISLPVCKHGDGMTLFLEAWMAQEAPTVIATTVTKIATPAPTILVTVDMFQTPRGSAGRARGSATPAPTIPVTVDNFQGSASPSPTSPVTVDTFQNPPGFEGLKASMAGLGLRVAAPGLVGNERVSGRLGWLFAAHLANF